MDYRKSNAARTTETRDVVDFKCASDNIYETISILSTRSNQIGSDLREHLVQKLNEFASSTDNLEEIFENREQIEISKFYEKLPKPTAIAIDEMLNDKIYIRKDSDK